MLETLKMTALRLSIMIQSTELPIHVKKESDIARSSTDERPSGRSWPLSKLEPVILPRDKFNSPAPTNLLFADRARSKTRLDYFEPGDDDVPDGDDPGDGGDGNGGMGEVDHRHHLNQMISLKGIRTRRVPRKSKGWFWSS